MKRSPALRKLSSDHHNALVLAKRMRRIACYGDMDQIMAGCRALRDRFEAELQPHFRIEEDKLLPLLAAAGETALVDRTRKEHQEVLGLVAAVACHPCRELMLAFSEVLEAHVRFEERTLFETAQARLSVEELAAALPPGASPRG